jgi:hypothetical protein
VRENIEKRLQVFIPIEMYGESHLKEFTLIHEIYNKFNYDVRVKIVNCH